MIFPDIASHGLCTRSDEITLALNKLAVDIFELKLDPKAVADLDTAWILIAGHPDIVRSERVIHNMARILGKVVVVDELSLRKEEEVRVKTKCLDSDKLCATLCVFFNDLGYDLKIRPEPPTTPVAQDPVMMDTTVRATLGVAGGMTTLAVAVMPALTTRRISSTTPTRHLRTSPLPPGWGFLWRGRHSHDGSPCVRLPPLPREVVGPRVTTCWWPPQSCPAPRPHLRSSMFPMMPSPSSPLPPKSRAQGWCNICPLL